MVDFAAAEKDAEDKPDASTEVDDGNPVSEGSPASAGAQVEEPQGTVVESTERDSLQAEIHPSFIT